jgi:hypothetical protein
MIRVTNRKTGGDGEYVGRPSPLGNPFVLGKDGDRETVVAKYLEWLRAEWKKNGPVKAELLRLAKVAEQGDLELTCWCAPQACHADKIKQAIEGINGKNKGGA